MYNKESWFYKEGEMIGKLEATAEGLTLETTTRRRLALERILDTHISQRPECMIDFRAGVKQGWVIVTGSTRGAFNDAK